MPENTKADLIFSCNAFQHIQRLSQSLAHLHGLVRPGAYLYANFGPVWSAPDGAHIEGLAHQGITYNFWENALLPPWTHLWFAEEALAILLERIHGAEFARAISRYVHHSSWINRLCLWDYLRIIQNSPWELVTWLSTEDFGYDYDPPHDTDVDARDLRNRIARKYGVEPAWLLKRDLEIILRA